MVQLRFLRTRLQFVQLAFALLLPLMSSGQNVEGILEQAQTLVAKDQLDSAQYLYQKAYQDGTYPLRSLAGLITVALSKSQLQAADSLCLLGEAILETQQTSDRLGLCQYWSSKGNFFTKNSQLQAALNAQRKVIELSQGLEESPAVYAYALFHTALTFEKLTAFDSSLYYAEKAYPLLLSALDSTDIGFANIYNGLAVCYQRANQLDKAKVFYLRAISTSEAHFGPTSSSLAMSLNNLSSIYRAEENYREAIQYSERSLRINQTLNDKAGTSSAYYALGIYHYFLGDYGRCKDYMEACIAIRKQIYAPMHYSLIGPYEVLGIVNEEGGNYTETLRWLAEGRKRILANYPKGSPLEGFNYENTSLAYKSIDQLDSALLYMQKADQVLPQVLPVNDYSMAVHYFSYADILYHRGEIEQSRKLLTQSNDIYRWLGMEKTSEYALNLVLNGLLFVKEGKWELAQEEFERALEQVRLKDENQLSASAFPWSPNTLLLLNHYSDFLYGKFRQTADLRDLGEFERAAQLYLQVSEKFRKQFTDPYTKSIFIKDNAEVYRRNIGVYQQLYFETNDPKYLKAVYQFSEHGRTCLLRDIQDDKITSFQGVPDSILTKEYDLKEQVSRISEQVLEYPDSLALKQILFEQEEALDQYLDHLSQHYPHYHRLKFNSDIPRLEEIQAQLGPTQSIIEYLQDDTAYYALVITMQENHLQYIGASDAIDKIVSSWKKAVTSRDQTATEKSGNQLYQILWEPIRRHLKGEYINLIPSGRLYYLNFEALKPEGVEQPFLIQDYNISYALSLNVLYNRSTPSSKGPIVFVAPGFEADIKVNYQAQLDTLSRIDEAFMKTVRQPWSLKLASQLQGQKGFQIYKGLAARESKIVEGIPGANVLYFSTHAIANADDPLRSKLVLAKELGEQIEDGYLHAYELFGLKLDADLAILNACESGIGNLQAGEGMISLAYSLQFAGCRSTALSLWKVDEKVNTQITATFLKNLQKGYNKSEAMRQAKLTYLQENTDQLSHPFYWAGIIHMGQDGIIRATSARNNWWLWILAVLGISIAFLFRRRILNLS